MFLTINTNANKTMVKKIFFAVIGFFMFAFLFVRSQAIDFDKHNLYISDLRLINEIDARINQNILQARYGLINSYDPITEDLTKLDVTLESLKKTPGFLDADSQDRLQEILAIYTKILRQKEQLIEDFNGANALVKNSLAYLPIAVANTVSENSADSNYEAIFLLNNLLRDILIYNASPRDDLVNEIAADIKTLLEEREEISSPISDSDLDIVLGHSRIILENLPRVNSLINEIVNLPTNEVSEQLSESYDRSYQEAIATTNIYRFLLYLLSILLLISISGSIIRKLRKSAAAIKEAEEKYRSIFENSIDGIFQITPEGRYLSVNPALAKIYGYSSPEELSTSITEIERQVYVYPHRWEELKTTVKKEGYVTGFESQVYRKDGKIIWVYEGASAVRDRLGNILYYEGIVTDITARKQAEFALKMEQRKSELLLLNVLPEAIAQRLKQNDKASIADHFDNVTVLFADIVGFTNLSTEMSPKELVNILNKIFSAFDLLVEKYGLEKIKTIGDAYMVVGGLPKPRPDHAEAIAEFALDILTEIDRLNRNIDRSFKVRVGINTGSAIAGVIGIKKFIYDLWGDTVNTASRMESHGLTGRIQVSDATYQILRDKYLFEPRGRISVKGKGEMMTYFLNGRI
ncbi:MAG: adenylate/guanylate cyclase domain-containing protein [Cyanobacteriota bacterium]|nr:adenylate/guanylate cyclase domain-containing protein [Cyanobacteriota bacterium]